MKTILIMALVIVIPTIANASSTCTTRKSGSYTKTSCSDSHGRSTHCTSYMSGSVRKTSCR